VEAGVEAGVDAAQEASGPVSCDINTGKVPINSCTACYQAFTVLGSTINCDNTQMPIAGSHGGVADLLGCYEACLNTANCAFFAYYPSAQWCNMTSACNAPYASSGTSGTLGQIGAPPSGGVSTCP
jgi:hypothetical protein